MGPFLMAALTDNSRDIRADPSAIASLIHNVSSAGLFTLADGKGAVLRQSNATLLAMQDSSLCAAAMECTFRLLRKRWARRRRTLILMRTVGFCSRFLARKCLFPGYGCDRAWVSVRTGLSLVTFAVWHQTERRS